MEKRATEPTLQESDVQKPMEKPLLWELKLPQHNEETYVKVHRSYQDSYEHGYSPFCFDDLMKKNYDDVVKTIPKYLDKYKGKNVVVNHCTASDTFITFSEETNGSTLPITDSYIIHDFDYKLYTTESLPCVKMISKDNENIYACAMGIQIVSATTLYCADEKYYLRIIN